MKTIEFLSHLRSLEVQIWAEGDRLRCRAPEGVLTAQLRSEIGDRKMEILAFLQQAKATLHKPELRLTPVVRSATIPLSFAQQRLWFLEQLVPENPFYNVSTAMRLTGALDITTLEQSFNEIIRRHEALRTSFRLQSAQPVQAIAPHLLISLPIVDLRSFPSFDRQAEAQKLAMAESQLPFSLAEAPLLRVKLLQFAETDFMLLLTMHHIVSDGWSIGVLVRELGALYTAFSAGKPSPLPDLPLQYADFAQWQRDQLQGEVLDTQLSYWRSQLADLSPLDLPIDRSRPPVQTYQGASRSLKLSAGLTQTLESLSQESGGTLFVTLLAAFQTLLHCYTRQTDIAVGSPIANRNRSEIEGLIGFFVNSLVLRTDLAGNPTFRELLERVKAIAVGAYAHQDLPFERLVEELQPDRDLSRNPLFQIVFALQNASNDALELPGIDLSAIEFDPGTTRFDLEFHVSSSADASLSVLAVYNIDLFEAETIDRLLQSFQILLESIAAKPEQRLSEIAVLSDRDRHQLAEWNQTQFNYPIDRCVHELFEAQVDRSPDALAVSFQGDQLTYRQLNQRSNQVARYLESLGITAETAIGICVDRSPDLIIGMLAILKAGGAYLPLDPTYPVERLAFMIKDAKVSILLTQQHLSERFDIPNCICLDRTDFSSYSGQNLDRAAANQLAYIIYTSGSTGQPKGVLVEHKSLLNLIFWHQRNFEISASDRASQIAGIAFDACGWEIFPYLAVGASIHFPNKETRLSPTQLQAWLIQERITVSFVPTPIAERLFSLDWPSEIALRLILTGGDKLHRSPPILPFAVVNNYGLTETTVVATSGKVITEVPTIGRAIANTELYVLDHYQQLVPIGAKGELYIGGDSLARGYLDRAELTAERFVSVNSKRLYRTGDLVRWRSNGELEFFGRADDQVKIRGLRIELGEIEAALREHDAVQAAIVVVHADAEDKWLVAYLTQSHAVAPEPIQDEQVLQWQMLYEDTYRQPPAAADLTFNIIGWNSSYTGQPLPAEQIREWVDRRVELILSHRPQRVLEIGCGTGLLLFRLAPHTIQYWGTDFSAVALGYIQQQLALPQVTLSRRMATDFSDIAPRSFDAIVLNSVVQYFPSVEYLMQVLAGAIASTAPGGFIFLGDIRSLPLLHLFHTAIQMTQADPSQSKAQLRQRIHTQILQEAELTIDPDFFHALRDRFPQINRVEIHLTQGDHHNEMTQFRYNVTLHIGQSIEIPTVSTCLDWSQDLSVAIVRQLLEKSPDHLCLANIPNARLGDALRAHAWLASKDSATIADLRAQSVAESGIDPEAFRALAQELPYSVCLSWADSKAEGRFDVLFTRHDAALVAFPNRSPVPRSQDYTNNPLQAKLAAHLVPQVRSHLRQRLPDYMIPAAFIVLEALPLTPNGKIDRRALPLPDRAQSARFAPARSPVEQTLAEIWCAVLGLKQVGIYDNFFELGGHSLLATQLVSRIRDRFAVELPLRSLFETRTIEGLAREIESLQANSSAPLPPIAALPREAYRVKLSPNKPPQ